MGSSSLGPAEEQPVAHQGETRGDHQRGHLFQALDHGAPSDRLLLSLPDVTCEDGEPFFPLLCCASNASARFIPPAKCFGR
jgi:hypothetical protein